MFGKDMKEHDNRLITAHGRIAEAGATLNPNKCELRKKQAKFLGHIIDKEGIWADPSKIAAVTETKYPIKTLELCRLMGMMNQLGKFSQNIANLSQPLW